jgi:HK97 family phage portal protein
MFTQMTRWAKAAFSPYRRMETKASSTASVGAYHALGKPVWTPKNYATLAEEGFSKNVVVYRAVQLIARSLGSVPLLLYQRKGAEEHELDNHPLLHLLRSPSPRQAGSAFMEAVVGYLLLAGNSYVEAVLDHRGEVIELYPLRPDRMRVIPGETGVPQSYVYSVNGQTKEIPVEPVTGQSCVLHLKNFHPLNDWYGFSPIEATSYAIDQHNTVSAHNMALMQNGGRPSGALIYRRTDNYTENVSPEQRELIQNQLKRFYEGPQSAGRILVMEGDFEWREMGLSPKDLDFIEGKNVSAREIAQAFGVPPMLVGVPGDATFANYREARLHLWEDTVLPLLEFIVAEFNLWLSPLFGENLRIGYDLDSIAALGPKREALWNRIQQSDFLTINEKRQAVGYSPLEERAGVRCQGLGTRDPNPENFLCAVRSNIATPKKRAKKPPKPLEKGEGGA